MERDFRVEKMCELVQGDRCFDLHNRYDFVGIRRGAAGMVTVAFRPNAVWGEGLQPVVLEFDEVDHLSLTFGRPDPDPGSLVGDIGDIGYIGPNEEWAGFIREEETAAPDDHLLFTLGSEGLLRIHARRARLRSGPNVLPGS
jgi:hypothetical protein